MPGRCSSSSSSSSSSSGSSAGGGSGGGGGGGCSSSRPHRRRRWWRWWLALVAATTVADLCSLASCLFQLLLYNVMHNNHSIIGRQPEHFQPLPAMGQHRHKVVESSRQVQRFAAAARGGMGLAASSSGQDCARDCDTSGGGAECSRRGRGGICAGGSLDRGRGRGAATAWARGRARYRWVKYV